MVHPTVTEANWTDISGTPKTTSGFIGEINYVKATVPNFCNEEVRIYFHVKAHKDSTYYKNRYFITTKTDSEGKINTAVSFSKEMKAKLGISNWNVNLKFALVKKSSVTKIEENLKSNKLVINQKKILLDAAQEKMFSVEEKWIKNEISKDTYDRWYNTYKEVTSCKDSITRLSHVDKHVFTILQKNLDLLVDLKSLYNRATITQKREFVKLVFDSNLYYQMVSIEHLQRLICYLVITC